MSPEHCQSSEAQLGMPLPPNKQTKHPPRKKKDDFSAHNLQCYLHFRHTTYLQTNTRAREMAQAMQMDLSFILGTI